MRKRLKKTVPSIHGELTLAALRFATAAMNFLKMMWEAFRFFFREKSDEVFN